MALLDNQAEATDQIAQTTSSSASPTSHTTQATTPPSHASPSPPRPPAIPAEHNGTDYTENSNDDVNDTIAADTPSDLPALRRQHLTTGYRAGVTAGKSDATVAQAAFDTGYAQGAAAGVRAGWVLAMVRALGGADEAATAESELVVAEFVRGRVGEGGAAGRWDALERWNARVRELGRERGAELTYPA